MAISSADHLCSAGRELQHGTRPGWSAPCPQLGRNEVVMIAMGEIFYLCDHHRNDFAAAGVEMELVDLDDD